MELYSTDAEWVEDYDARIWVSQMFDGNNEKFVIDMEQQAILDELRISRGHSSRLIRRA